VTFNLDYVIKLSKNNQITKEKEQKIETITNSKEKKIPSIQTLFHWQEESKDMVHKEYSNELVMELIEKFEEIHGVGTFNIETLCEMEDGEIIMNSKENRKEFPPKQTLFDWQEESRETLQEECSNVLVMELKEKY
jgi:kynurenine formamidase